MRAGVFYIEPTTGVIRNIVDLDGFAGTYEMVVRAVDHGIPALSGVAYVTIIVLGRLLHPLWITPATDDYVEYIREVLTSHLLYINLYSPTSGSKTNNSQHKA